MPSIAKDLGFSGAGLSLAVSIGTLSLAATVIAIGALADRIGVRRVIMIGLVLEALGNLIVAVSPSLAVLLLGRVVAGVGMGALFAGAFSMVPAIAGKRTIAAVIGQWTGLLYIFTIIFSIIGSALIGISWRAGFILIPVVCLIMMLVVPKTLPETPRRGSSKFDFLGLSTLGLGMVLVLVAVSLAATSLAGILWNFGESGMLLQASNFWQHVVGVSPSVVGVAIAPLLIAGIIAGFAAGALLGRGMSPVLIQAIGFILMILGFLSVAFTTVDTKLVAFFPALILVGLGMVAVAVVQAREYVAEAPAKYLSAVVSSRTSVGQLGYSLGVALTSTLIALGVSEEGGDVVPSEFVPAFNSTMLIVAGILAVGGVITAILLSIGLKRRKTLALAGPSDAPLEPSSGEQPLG